MSSAAYPGQELDLFAHARNWKSYWSKSIRRWISGEVLEVGAGIGVNTPYLRNERVTSIHCLEPDPKLERRLREAIAGLPGCESSVGMTMDLAGRSYDTIVYIDVLEHIEDDREEMRRASGLLRLGGHVIVLSPAHQFLFSPFDASVGHFRRYNRKTLFACTPAGCRAEKLFYLDSLGMAASMANRILLKQDNPTLQQILTWDNYIVPASRIADRLFGFTGKTIIGVWRKEA